jgi:hypothetical protein
MSLANWFLPRFKLYRKQLNQSEKDTFIGIFDNIEFSFKCLLDNFKEYDSLARDSDDKKAYRKRFRKGFKLLGKYIRNLWW